MTYNSWKIWVITGYYTVKKGETKIEEIYTEFEEEMTYIHNTSESIYPYFYSTRNLEIRHIHDQFNNTPLIQM